MKTAARWSALVALIGLGLPLGAAELGDKAPPLQVAEWVKGKPVDLAASKGKTVTVVEFWATWCGPCRVSIPHLTELQKKFKDKGVVFVGVSTEDTSVVKKFVQQMGSKMDYTVAVDKDSQTDKGYMEAFGIDGIPHAFVVDKEGRIVWNGHPMADLERTLDDIVAGKFDLAIAKKRDLAQKKAGEFVQIASENAEDARLEMLGSEVETLDKEVGGIEQGEKFNAAEIRKSIKFEKAARAYQTAMVSGAEGAGLDTLGKQVQEFAPKDFVMADFKQTVEAQIVFGKYLQAVSTDTDKTTVAELTAQVKALKVKNPQLLSDVALAMLTDERVKQRDVPLATTLAKAAVDNSDSKEPVALDVYARALFDSGKVSEAVETQKKALALCKDELDRQEMEEHLQTYQAKAAAK